jgi:hypothetical protein
MSTFHTGCRVFQGVAVGGRPSRSAGHPVLEIPTKSLKHALGQDPMLSIYGWSMVSCAAS